MSRIRSVKPDWLDDELALAHSDTRILSIALILLADDYGYGRANRTILCARVFPGQAASVLEAALMELSVKLRFVELYEADGQQYFHIRNWEKHQKVDHPGKPQVPGPPTPSKKSRRSSRSPRESLANPPDVLALTRARSGIGREGKGMEGNGSREHASTLEEDWSGSEEESLCPERLVEKATELGVLKRMAEKLKAPLPSIEAKAHEFQSYWTIGGGMGQKRRHWMKRLREDIRKGAEQGKLKPPGEVEAAELKASERKATDATLIAEAKAGKFGAKVQRDVEAGKLSAAVLRALLEERRQERAAGAM